MDREGKTEPMFEHRWHILYYEHVPLWLWPAVWWQLWQIDRWTAHFGRQVFVEVDPDGTVYSVYWEGMEQEWDDETGEVIRLGWRPEDLAPLLPNSPAWQAAFSPEASHTQTALSPVHGLAQPDRNPLRAVCAEGAQNSAQTQPPLTLPRNTLQLGLPLPFF